MLRAIWVSGEILEFAYSPFCVLQGNFCIFCSDISSFTMSYRHRYFFDIGEPGRLTYNLQIHPAVQVFTTAIECESAGNNTEASYDLKAIANSDKERVTS